MVPKLGLWGSLLALAGGLELFAGRHTMLTILYPLKLKRLAMIDICALAKLYILRILASSAATGVHSSMWLLAFATFFF